MRDFLTRVFLKLATLLLFASFLYLFANLSYEGMAKPYLNGIKESLEERNSVIAEYYEQLGETVEIEETGKGITFDQLIEGLDNFFVIEFKKGGVVKVRGSEKFRVEI